MPSTDEKRRAFIDAANQSLQDFRRTGIAYTHADVMNYVLDKAAGKNPQKPKPIKVSRAKR